MNIKKTIAINIFLILIYHIAPAQTNKSLIGKWYVDEVIILKDSFPQDEIENLNDLFLSFKSSSFLLGENEKFIFDISLEEMKMPDGKWAYDSINKTLIVTEIEDSKSILMKINIEQNTFGETYFILRETPLKLKMRKKEIYTR